MNKRRKNLLIDNLESVPYLCRDITSLSKIFSDKVGIINAILMRFELQRYGLNMFQCLSAQTKILFNLKREVSTGGLGVDFSAQNAFLACIGEAIERYCMSYVDGREIFLKFLNEIPANNKVNKFHLYTRKQYKVFRNFVNPEHARIHWTKITNYLDPSDYIFWPASLVYLPFEHGKIVAETTSTGVAAHFDFDSAIESGLLELIERDALMINFLQRLNPPEIDLETLVNIRKDFITKIINNYNVKIYKLYSDIEIPIYAGFIWKEAKNGLHFGIGASANLDSDQAVLKVLKECLFTYFYSRNLLDLRQKNVDKISTLYEHFLYYQSQEFYKLLFKPSKIIPYNRQILDRPHLFNEIKKHKLKVYFKELTTQDVRDFGMAVVRVVIPSLIDLNKTHKLRREAATRFWSVPKRLGLKPLKELYSLPHPFP